MLPMKTKRSELDKLDVAVIHYVADRGRVDDSRRAYYEMADELKTDVDILERRMLRLRNIGVMDRLRAWEKYVWVIADRTPDWPK